MKKLHAIFCGIFITCICVTDASSQTANKPVVPGQNPFSWSGSLPIGTPTTLNATFTPSIHSFIAGSGYAAPIYGVNWTTIQNSESCAHFRMTATFSGAAKSYPTYFQGKFRVQGTAPGTPPMWEASSAFSQYSKPHSYYNISYVASNFTFNHVATATQYTLNFNYNMPNATHYQLVSYQINNARGHFIANCNYGATKPQITDSVRIPVTCKIPGVPTCTKMVQGEFQVIGTYTDAPKINMPVWNQAATPPQGIAGPKTRAAWAAYMVNLLAHEKEHDTVYTGFFRDNQWWSTWAKIKYVIEVCVDDQQQAYAIALEYVSDLNARANMEYDLMYQAYQARQQKVDDDEVAAGTPMYNPIRSTTITLKE